MLSFASILSATAEILLLTVYAPYSRDNIADVVCNAPGYNQQHNANRLQSQSRFDYDYDYDYGYDDRSSNGPVYNYDHYEQSYISYEQQHPFLPPVNNDDDYDDILLRDEYDDAYYRYDDVDYFADDKYFDEEAYYLESDMDWAPEDFRRLSTAHIAAKPLGENREQKGEKEKEKEEEEEAAAARKEAALQLEARYQSQSQSQFSHGRTGRQGRRVQSLGHRRNNHNDDYYHDDHHNDDYYHDDHHNDDHHHDDDNRDDDQDDTKNDDLRRMEYSFRYRADMEERHSHLHRFRHQHQHRHRNKYSVAVEAPTVFKQPFSCTAVGLEEKEEKNEPFFQTVQCLH
jgi:hypothetical protein